MGIKNLNRFFLDNCSDNSITKIRLDEMQNLTIAIDVSIYIYKYVEKDALIENLYLMVSKFLHHKITPVFIFDGKPPTEKMELIEKRKQEKNVAEEKFNTLKEQLADVQHDQTKTEEIKTEMDMLKRKFVRIKTAHLRLAKSLFDAMGVYYIEAKGEADHLCAYLAKHNYVWACMSDDMDMFLLDCPRVLRHLSLVGDTVLYYNTSAILRELDMSYADFKYILMLSGTDYNIGDDVPHLYDIVDKYCVYRNEIKHGKSSTGVQQQHTPPSSSSSHARTVCDVRKNGYFEHWLVQNKHFPVDGQKMEHLSIMYNLSVFALKHNEELREIIEAYPFIPKPQNTEELAKLLQGDAVDVAQEK